MDEGNVIAIFIALIAALGSWASHRATAKANSDNAKASNRVEMEKEAYDRARKLDVETIERQVGEMAELQTKNRELSERNEELSSQVHELQARVTQLEARIRSMEEGNHAQH